MSEHFKEQISVFIDDELSAEECEFFVRRLQRDPESRSQYIRYQLISAAIRGEQVIPDDGALRARVQSALAGRREELASPKHGGGKRWLIGAGIAATVAVVALVGLRFANIAPVPAGVFADDERDQRLELFEPPTYVVPIRMQEARVATPEIRLTGLQYLMHHGAYASSLGRNIVHTNLVADPDDVADEEVEIQ